VFVLELVIELAIVLAVVFAAALASVLALEVVLLVFVFACVFALSLSLELLLIVMLILELEMEMELVRLSIIRKVTRSARVTVWAVGIVRNAPFWDKRGVPILSVTIKITAKRNRHEERKQILSNISINRIVMGNDRDSF
jgi:hypothetical protein